jgi:hypothetical protein
MIAERSYGYPEDYEYSVDEYAHTYANLTPAGRVTD